MHGNTLNLILLKKEEATNLRWFLRQANHRPILLLPGTNVQMSSEGQAGLRVAHMSRHWAGNPPLFLLSPFSPMGFLRERRLSL